ncbi:MAG: subclass B3 metallo-beta-lactamase [Gemmatimonadota bacterium]|nr:subclass B3 metallo-beta-lactamase [Gemmatimonadota bacterium]MDH3422730.1 subclass B3 metallo-beta-lactamase [Gemmatimonadota bacterium]
MRDRSIRAVYTVILTTVASLALAGPLQAQELPRLLPDDLFRRNIGGEGQMDARFAPHRVMDNIYYVGTGSLASFLITTPQGHILVNSCFNRTVPLIRESVEELGFNFEDIRIVLGSHAHGDHMQGDALVKELTGAQVMVMGDDVPLLQPRNPADPMPPIDRMLYDGETVSLGGEVLTAHRTPGHTPGCTSWELDVQESGRTYKALINCSIGVNPNYQLYQNPDRPTIVEEYRYSYAKLRSLDIDIPLGSHPGMYNLEEKFPRIGQTPNPFIDPEGYRYEIAINEQAMGLRLEEQRAAAAR